MMRRSIWAASLACGLSIACGSGRDIDPAPYRQMCHPDIGDCPSPYVCLPNYPPGAGYCYVPCSGDTDCPDGFMCTPLDVPQGDPPDYCTKP